jgi:hypothetical protein
MAGVLAGALFLLNCAAAAEPRFIRLRNELIDTDHPVRTTVPPGTTQPPAQTGSGLFLIQFRNHLQAAWRSELATRQVELLNYVPDDAFVARFNNAELAQVRALPFVRWVGPYQPEHKQHAGLRAASLARPQEQHSVTIVLAPKAAPAETLAVRALFRSLSQQARHRFGDVWRGTMPGHSISLLAASPAVLWIEPGPRFKLNDETASRIVAGEGTGHALFTQELGFDGRGVRVAVADSGLDTGRTNDMHPDLFGRVAAFFFYGTLTNASDKHSHGTHVAGIIAGNGATGEVNEFDALYGLGVAPGATLVAQRMFDGAGGYEPPPTFEILTHDAVRAGADIGSNSWTDDTTEGRYDVSAAEFDALVRDADADTPGDQQYVLEFSAGNTGAAGAQTIGSPAVAKNVIATGASQNNWSDLISFTEGKDAMAYFSSRGPAEDGRIKPDVVAPGTWIASLRSEYADDNNALAPISDRYMYQRGTSQAGPHVSGAAAVFIQFYRETFANGSPSPALVKASLINAAVDMNDESGTGPTPNMDEGWGRVDLTEIIGSERAHEFIDQTNLLVTGQVHERHVIISSTNQPLKITLAYTDYPGFPAVLPALVNDLDLEVVAPDGRVYRGNQFDLGESLPDAPGSDNLNNVEGVHIRAPQAGDYLVRVIARNVIEDSRLDTPAPDQDFALVICGDILPPEAGIILLDRAAYRAPSVAKIKLIDADLAGLPSALVILRSATETNGVLVSLTAQDTASGILTGGVATATGPAANDGKLQIAHGDWIRVDYYDLADGVLRSAHAVADLVPPVISQVMVTNQFGQRVVTWLTDEPANSVVRYNTNTTLARAATNFVITTQHQVELTNLVTGLTYYYRVESTDVAGNTASNSVVVSFVAQPAATVLLVNNYIPDDDLGTPFIPVSAYTDILAQLGVSFDVWNATASSSALPGFNTLRPYPIVIWRVNDSWARADSIPSTQQAALQQYLNAGGSFFMSSMQIIARLGAVPFRANVLHVQQFTANPDPSGCPCSNCDEDIGVPVIEGGASDPISRGVLLALDYSHYFEDDLGLCISGPDLSDTFTADTNAAPMVFSATTGRACGVRFPRTGQDSTGRVVFCSFPLDAIPETGDAPNNRAAFLRNVIQFLAPGLGGLGTIALNQGKYRLPDLVTVEVSDADLAGGPGPQVFFHSDSDPVPMSVALQETTQSGLFRGFIPLLATTEPPAPGRLRAMHGDSIYAEYFDAAVTVAAEATVDGIAPQITGIVIKPGFDSAMISWSTDEPTDALVQFGESAFLGRTAYLPDASYDHEVHLTGLMPDRLYYFQIVSRDSAGNAGVADNGGTYFLVRTRPPLPPPFYDMMDDAGTNWTVISSGDSASSWGNGSPNNGVEVMAHSPLHCWGSSLYGANSSVIDTSLKSPAIELTGGNVATLRFWHSYDFTAKSGLDIMESGRLLLVTNSLSAPVTLTNYSGGNFMWEEAQFDLTPYVGRVVFLIWHHQLHSLESAFRSGWLVDDVSIIMSNVPPVTVRVTNNLAQARFTLGGASPRAGQGHDTFFTNLPPGTYTVTWNAVPYYQTPVRQTNALASGGSATFTGLYIFADVNTNGISDPWEIQYFSTVSANRTRYTDTDGDGFTDYAEFIAGTNPTLPNSHLRLFNHVTSPGGGNLLQWPAVPGRIYQVQGTHNFTQWTALSGWMQAVSNSVFLPLPAPASGQPYIHRLEVRP